MTKSRQLREPIDEKSSGLPEGQNYCRKCQRIRPSDNFGRAVDLELDSGGRLSFCKDCVDLMYEKILIAENGSIQKTVLHLCKKLNIRYEERAIESALRQIETKGSNPLKLFGLYRAKLLVILRENVNDTNIDLTYQFDDGVSISVDETKFQKEEYLDMDELRKFWGKNFEPEEIIILEGKFSDWSKSHSIDTQSERVLLKFICLKEYEVDKAVIAGGSTASLMKEFQELLKTSALSPAMASSGSGGKSMDAFGVWLKEIGEMRPEEWVEDKSIYKDVDNIEDYNERIIVSPLRAFVTGSREFSLDADEVVEEESEGE